jgi:hypothetical protein
MWFGLPFTLRRIRDYAVRTISGEPVLAQVIPEPAEVRLFGVRNNGDDRVGVPLHLKIESPVTIYSGLPNIIGLMARSEGWRRFSATGQPVCRKLSARTWERLDSPARRGGLGATSSTMALSSPGGFPTLAFKSGQHFGGTGNGPMDAALLEVVHPSARARSTMDLGVNTILPLSAWASRTSPIRTPTCLRTRCGITTWYLFLMVTMGIGELFNR